MRTSESVKIPTVQPPRLRLTATYKEAHHTWLDWAWLYPMGEETKVVRLADHSMPGFRQLESEQAVIDVLAGGPLGERPGLLPTIAGRSRLSSPVSLVGMGAATFTENCLPWLEDCDEVDVVTIPMDDAGLIPDELERGYILTCQSHPTTETVVVDYDV